MKEKYEKPVIKSIQVDLNECIASSIELNQGNEEHIIFNEDKGTREWGNEVFELDNEGNRIK